MDGPKGPNVHVLTAPDLGLPDVVNAFFPLAQALGWTVFQSAGTSYLVYFGRDDAAEIADLTAIAEAEAEIARRDLTNQYVAELVRLLGPQIFADELTLEGAYTYGNRAILSFDREHRAVFTATGPALFVLITAPPEARVRAMLEVLKG
jgi:hypothetical protein